MDPERTLIFVDGENLSIRYQEMLKAGHIPASDNVSIADCFIWNQNVFSKNYWNIVRVAYYTSVVGDDEKVRNVREQIGAVPFVYNTGTITYPLRVVYSTKSGQIVPFVRKKPAKSRKESICDIAITVDILRACYRDHAETIWLFSGDGDFLTLTKEVMHSGKRVYVSAFSSGLNEELKYSVDEFISLDEFFFVSQSATQKAQLQDANVTP